MREHVGIDVDALADEDHASHEVSLHERVQKQWDTNAEQETPGRQVTELAHERPLRDALHTVANEIKEGT